MLTNTATLVLTLLIAAADKPTDKATTARETMQAYLHAFADADLKAMGVIYADKVTVMRGSTLLDKKYGGLGGEDGRTKDQTVSRDALLNAYKQAIEVFGGKKDWINRHQRFKTIEVIYITDDSENADKIFAAVGAKKGDVLAVVNPKGDELFFHLRKNEGKWQVIAEAWN